MRTIFKYPFEIEDEFRLELPFGAKFLSAEIQQNGGGLGQPTMWAEVESDNTTSPRYFAIRGTGHALDFGRPAFFLATFQQGPFVWHLFELDDGPPPLPEEETVVD